MPLGISFITFEHVSYLLDIRKGSAGLYPLMRYLSYISFFPHLISGPIVRHYELMPQLRNINQIKVSVQNISHGLMLFIIGLVKKVFIADKVAPLSDILFTKAASGEALSFAEAWLTPIAFGVQVYYDFSGYTDMALGIALMFGIVLPINFDTPYSSTSIRQFWRRWHITLSRFLRDYVYIPIGGSKNGIVIQCVAAMVTMTLCGLWHGVGWMFVLWGVWHGVLLIINIFWNKYSPIKLPSFISWLFTFIPVILGWILFRAQDWVL